MKVVHYVAHGQGGDFYSCYQQELRAYVASGEWDSRDPKLRPLRHTSLSKVTCLDCWRHIYAKAGRKVLDAT